MSRRKCKRVCTFEAGGRRRRASCSCIPTRRGPGSPAATSDRRAVTTGGKAGPFERGGPVLALGCYITGGPRNGCTESRSRRSGLRRLGCPAGEPPPSGIGSAARLSLVSGAARCRTDGGCSPVGCQGRPASAGHLDRSLSHCSPSTMQDARDGNRHPPRVMCLRNGQAMNCRLWLFWLSMGWWNSPCATTSRIRALFQDSRSCCCRSSL